MRLKGKVAIVTGAGSGFGAGIARRFAEEGAKVFVVDIDEKNGQQVARELNSPFIQADVTRSADWARLVAAASGVSIVVNNKHRTRRVSHRSILYTIMVEA